MEKYLISIIIPVYNVENFIEKCVKSVLSQDYQNIEVILVDDGSPDKSPKIIDELSKIDKRIVVIHKNNGGVSSARNAGIDISSGDYLMFIDGDDYVDKNYVSHFISILQESNQLICFNKINYNNDLIKKKNINGYSIIPSEKAMEYIFLGDVFVAVWNKIYNSHFIKENHIKFNEKIWYGEGMLFNIECLSKIDKIAVCSYNVYHQVSNPNSAMRKFNLESNHCGIRSVDLQFQFLNKKNKRLLRAWKYHRWCFNWTILSGLVRTNSENEHLEEFEQCRTNLKKGGLLPFIVKTNFKEKVRCLVLEIYPEFMIKKVKRKTKIGKSNYE